MKKRIHNLLFFLLALPLGLAAVEKTLYDCRKGRTIEAVKRLVINDFSSISIWTTALDEVSLFPYKGASDEAAKASRINYDEETQTLTFQGDTGSCREPKKNENEFTGGRITFDPCLTFDPNEFPQKTGDEPIEFSFGDLVVKQLPACVHTDIGVYDLYENGSFNLRNQGQTRIDGLVRIEKVSNEIHLDLFIPETANLEIHGPPYSIVDIQGGLSGSLYMNTANCLLDINHKP